MLTNLDARLSPHAPAVLSIFRVVFALLFLCHATSHLFGWPMAEQQAPVDKDLYELPPEEAANIPQAPTSLSAVIDRLEEDHDYLTEGGVFTEDLIETWISYKRENEIMPIQIRPHPYEFALYYDV